MNKLSRTKRYHDLREQLDESTTVVDEEEKRSNPTLAQNNNLSHANQPLHPHEEEEVLSNKKSAEQTSRTMDELLGEVKQYNIENGSRVTDDTQINILRQLDGDSTSERKNRHFVEMDEEPMNDTVKLPRAVKDEFDVSSFLEEQSLNANKKAKKDKIILDENDIFANDDEFSDDLELFDDSKLFEDPKKKNDKKLGKEKKNKSKKNRKGKREEDLFEDVETGSRAKPNKSEHTLNIILGVLVVLLVVVIIVTFMMLKGIGIH